MSKGTLATSLDLWCRKGFIIYSNTNTGENIDLKTLSSFSVSSTPGYGKRCNS